MDAGSKKSNTAIEIRRWAESDEISQITKLLHRSYAQLAALGFRYHATWQNDDTTLQRLRKGISFLAVDDQSILGTITLYLPPNVSGCDWYDRGDVAVFGQFGVDPDHQKAGIGSLLLASVETEAKNRGIPNLALDTAEGATHLIKLYKNKGYKFSGYADWEITNYRSVILNKRMKTDG